MGTEYKFMFDRRFDKKPPSSKKASKPVFETKKKPSFVPSISDLLDTMGSTSDDNNEVIADKKPIIVEETPLPVIPAETASKPDVVPIVADVSIPILPTFSQEELESAKTLAFDEGVEKGLNDGRQTAWNEAMASIEKQNADMLELLNERLKTLSPLFQQSVDNASTMALEFALAVCKKVLPAAAQKNALEEITNLLENNFRFLKEEPKITLRLHSTLVDDIKKQIQNIVVKDSFAGKVVVVRDDDVAVGDCKIEWKNGGLDRNVQDILNQTEELVKLYTASPSIPLGEELNG